MRWIVLGLSFDVLILSQLPLSKGTKMKYALALLMLLSLTGCSEGPYEVNDEFKQQFINLKAGETTVDDAELLLGRPHIVRPLKVVTTGPSLDEVAGLVEPEIKPAEWNRGWRIVDSEGNKRVYLVSHFTPGSGTKRGQRCIEAKKFFDLSVSYDREAWERMYPRNGTTWRPVKTREP